MASCTRRVVAMVASLLFMSHGLVDPGVLDPGRVDTGLDDVVEVDPVLVRGVCCSPSAGGLAPVGRSSLKAVPVVALNSEFPVGTVMACARDCRGSSLIDSSS